MPLSLRPRHDANLNNDIGLIVRSPRFLFRFPRPEHGSLDRRQALRDLRAPVRLRVHAERAREGAQLERAPVVVSETW